MSKARPENKQEFKDYLIRRLGGEFHPIEISDDNLEDAVMDALTFYQEQIFDGTKDVVYNLEVTLGTLEYDLHSLVNDGIFAVTEVLDSGFQTSLLPSSFGLSQNEVNFLFSLGSIPSGGLVDFSIKMQHLSAFQSLFLPKSVWNFNYGTGILQFKSDPFKVGSSNGQGMMHLVCSQLLDYDGSGSGRYWSNRFLLNLAEANLWIQYGYNLGKYDGLGFAGGGSVNFQAFIDRGTQKKTELEQFAYDNLSRTPESYQIWTA